MVREMVPTESARELGSLLIRERQKEIVLGGNIWTVMSRKKEKPLGELCSSVIPTPLASEVGGSFNSESLGTAVRTVSETSASYGVY
jgi:hypothetical protein